MNKIISIALLIGGIVLLTYGISASESISSDFSRFFTGKPTEKSIWMLIGGFIAIVVGAGGLLRSNRVD